MKNYLYGLKKGLPIALGYLAVAFAFGVMTSSNGMSPILSIIISATNLTSAGQYAGVKMILEVASYFEIGLTVLLINLRYSLMSISLSQKIDPNIPTWKRLIFGFGISDETFAVAMLEEGELSAEYMFGLITFPIIFWTGGTAIGALCAGLFSERVLNALDFTLYAMFIAIIIPDAKKSLPITIVILISALLSTAMYFIPGIKEIGVGFKIIISTLIASIFGALVFPTEKKEVPIRKTEEAKDAI